MQLFNATYSFFMLPLGFIEIPGLALSVLPSHPTHLQGTMKQSLTVCTGLRLHPGNAAHQVKDFIVPNPEMQTLRFASESPKKAP